MNLFLEAHGDVPFQVPGSAFARFEQTEPSDLREAEEAVFVLSAVSADWLGAQRDPMYQLSEPRTLESLWKNYWKRSFIKKEGRLEIDTPEDPYDPMHLLRYEITLRAWEKGFEEYRRICGEESGWFRIDRDPGSQVVAEVYGNVFGAPVEANVRIARVDKGTGAALSVIFGMDQWPDATEIEIERELSARAQRAYELAAFDIGQGSATALLDQRHMPFVYHDLGAGIARNAGTTPLPLKFCWTNDPLVILSHWDKDHWAGALRDQNALPRVWIVPRQVIPPGHAAFATSILSAGGQVLVWPTGVPPLSISLCMHQSLTLGRCKGSGRNGSGLAIRVDNDGGGGLLHWLATGDAGYDELPFGLPGQVVAICIPHHGAKMKTNGAVPAGPGSGYGRLLYSFGPGNAHGRTHVQHPTSASISEHHSAGWSLGAWQGVLHPGVTRAGGHVLATGQHSSTNLGGAVAGWISAPVPAARPCGARSCTTTIKQS